MVTFLVVCEVEDSVGVDARVSTYKQCSLKSKCGPVRVNIGFEPGDESQAYQGEYRVNPNHVYPFVRQSLLLQSHVAAICC
jgi:hypothetical protein